MVKWNDPLRLVGIILGFRDGFSWKMRFMAFYGLLVNVYLHLCLYTLF